MRNISLKQHFVTAVPNCPIIALMNAGKYVCTIFFFDLSLLIFMYIKCLGLNPFPKVCNMPTKELAHSIISSMNASKEVDEPLYKRHLALFVSNNAVHVV